jgi:hypothetical protein
MVGLAGAFALTLLAGPVPAGVNVKRIVLIAVVTMVIFHGLHLPAEAHIRATAFRLAKTLAVCEVDERGR